MIVGTGESFDVLADNSRNFDVFLRLCTQGFDEGDGVRLGDDVDAVSEGNLSDLGIQNGRAGEFPVGRDDAAVFEEVRVEECGRVVFGGEG